MKICLRDTVAVDPERIRQFHQHARNFQVSSRIHRNFNWSVSYTRVDRAFVKSDT